MKEEAHDGDRNKFSERTRKKEYMLFCAAVGKEYSANADSAVHESLHEDQNSTMTE